jgi:hypothetical protein
MRWGYRIGHRSSCPSSDTEDDLHFIDEDIATATEHKDQAEVDSLNEIRDRLVAAPQP